MLACVLKIDCAKEIIKEFANEGRNVSAVISKYLDLFLSVRGKRDTYFARIFRFDARNILKVHYKNFSRTFENCQVGQRIDPLKYRYAGVRYES